MTQRAYQLTFLSAVFGPLLLASAACFVTPESEGYYYEYDSSGACQNGEVGCACTPGGLCDEGLRCETMLNTCVVKGDCAIGARGCECTEAGTCDPGNVCKEELCVN